MKKNNDKGSEMEKLEVWLDDIRNTKLVGFLYQQNNQFWFEYSTNWLEFKKILKLIQIYLYKYFYKH